MRPSRPGSELEWVRFWSKTVIRENGCIEWTGHRIPQGYGNFRVVGRWHMAHRVSYRMVYGEIPDGLVIDHLCRNPPCVNPAHLEAVTTQENTLRGDTFQARNAAKTHCIRGHEFTAENIRAIYGKTGKPARACRACEPLKDKRRRARSAELEALPNTVKESHDSAA